jgi:arylsulfatase A-like enzyme
MMNESLEYEDMPPDRASMQRQGTAVLKIVAILLERLRQLEVFHNSLIFVVGDHGSGTPGTFINESLLGESFNTRGPYKGNFRSFKAAGIPLILVKRIGASGEMRTSDAPVCLADIPQTVVEELGLEARFPGVSVFTVKEDEGRERIYRAFVGPQEDVEYLAPLYEYAVRGFSWDDTSWRETGNVYYPPK